MNTISQAQFQKILDEVLQDITQQLAGIQLCPQEETPENDEMYTLYTTFEGGYQASIALCAEVALLTRLTQYMMQEEHIAQEDIEDFAKEYFNVLCGQIAAGLFNATHIASRFGVPNFHLGRYTPSGTGEQLVLNYTSDQHESAQVIHQAEQPLAHENTQMQAEKPLHKKS